MAGQNPPCAAPKLPMPSAGVQELLSAWKYASNLGRPPSDFAVEIEALRQLGLGNSDLRWLICNGYIQHFIDQSHFDQLGRVIVSTESLRLVPESCFILTPAGLSLAGFCEVNVQQNGGGKGLSLTRSDLPSWDTTSRVLRLGTEVVAVFDSRAPAQELILAAFEEEGWPRRIDDPLVPKLGANRKLRLSKTVHRINKRLQSIRIHFSSDGRGKGVCWHENGAASCICDDES